MLDSPQRKPGIWVFETPSDASEGIRQGLEELRLGQGRPASEFFDEMRAK